MSEFILNKGNLERTNEKPDYTLKHSSDLLSHVTNLIPLVSGVSGNRVLLGDKSFLQAITLPGRETPWVSSTSSTDNPGFNHEYSHLVSVKAPHSGEVTHVKADKITLTNNGKSTDVHLFSNYTSGKKNFIDQNPVVKVGDKINKGDLLATSNFSDKHGDLAVGVNLNTAIMPYRGHNFEDGYVITQSGADKLKGQQIISFTMEKIMGIETNKSRFVSLFPNKFTNSQLANIDEDGIAKKGTVLHHGDPVILACSPKSLKSTDIQLGKLTKVLKNAFNDQSETWHYSSAGTVVDVAKAGKIITVNVKADRNMSVGDKLSSAFGIKGVCTKILSDAETPHDSSGKPIDIFLNSMSITSRVSPALVSVLATGKVAQHLGKPIELPAFAKTSVVQEAKDLLAKHGISESDEIDDPVTGKKVKVTVGPLYYSRLGHIGEDKLTERGEGAGYDINSQPNKGGQDSSCLTPDHEVLTLTGWKNITEIDSEDEVYSITSDLEIVSSKVLELHSEDYSGELYCLSNRQISVKMTPNHNVFTKQASSAKYSLRKIKDVWDKPFWLCKTGNLVQDKQWNWSDLLTDLTQEGSWNKTKKVTTVSNRAAMWLFGLYLADGHSFWIERNGDYGFVITQKKEKTDRKIKKLFSKFGFKYSYRATATTPQYVFNSKDIAGYLRKLGKSYEKYIPNEIFEKCNRKELLALYSGMMLGDGSVIEGKRVYNTSSPQLANDFQRICLLLGYGATISVKEGGYSVKFPNGYTSIARTRYTVNISIYQNTPCIDRRLSEKRNIQLSKYFIESYTGKVYCPVLDKHHTFYVRRNGKPHWTGNSKKQGHQLTMALLSHGACFMGCVNILTENGYEDISTIVNNRKKIKVLSYNSEKNILEYKTIVNWFCRSVDEADRLTVSANVRGNGKDVGLTSKKIKCTRGHEFYTPTGKKAAGLLKAGDTIYTPGKVITDWQEKLLIGGIMGDAYISEAGVYSVAHGHKQVGYLNWKFSKLKNIGKSAPKLQKVSVGSFSKLPTSRFSLPVTPLIRRLRDEFYIDKVKRVPKGIVDRLGWVGVAIWFADDGSCVFSSKDQAIYGFRFHTCAFTEEENLQLANELSLFSGLPWKVIHSGKYPVLHLNKGGRDNDYIQEWINKIKDYLPSELAYKLRLNPEDCGSYWKDLMPDFSSTIVECEVREVSPYTIAYYENSLVYNIEVEGNHNYFAGDILVGNSNFLEDSTLVRGTQNHEYWRRFKLGQPLPPPQVPFIFHKFIDSLKGSGINVTENNGMYRLLPQTDKDVEKLSHGKIQTPDTFRVRKNDLIPEKGGLFDPTIVGITGDRFNHIELNMKVPNPISEDYLRKLLGLKKEDYYKAITDGTLEKKLEDINIDDKIKEYKEYLKGGNKTKRNVAVGSLQFLNTLKEHSIHPKDLMLSKIPVIPAKFRPASATPTNIISADVNGLYKDLMLNNEAIKSVDVLPDEEAKHNLKLDQYKAVKAIYGFDDPINMKNKQKGLKGLLSSVLGLHGGSGKESMFQAKVVNHPVDLVTRGVLSGDPGLGIDQISLPHESIWKIYSPFATRRLVQKGIPATQAHEYVKHQHPLAWKETLEECKERPVVLTRDPILHRMSSMGAYVRPNADPHDATVKLNPLLFKTLGADLDGNCCIGSTKIIVDFPLENCQYLEMFTKSAKVISKLENNVIAEISIEDFPRIEGSEKLDRNGAYVYNVPAGIKILSTNTDGKSARWCDVESFTVEQGCELKKVVTARGKEVVVSSNESLAVYDNEKGLARITPKKALGQLVPVIKKIPSNGTKYTKSLGWLFGAFLSDGWVSGDRTIGYSKVSPQHRLKFVEGVCEFTGNATEYKSYSSLHEASTNCGISGVSEKIHISGEDKKELISYLQQMYSITPEEKGANGRSCLFKRMPLDLFDYSEDALIGLLSGLLDGDGTFALNKSKVAIQVNASFCTSSQGLKDGFIFLCQLLGIRVAVSEVHPSATRVQKNINYSIALSTVDLVQYVDRLNVFESEAYLYLKENGVSKDDRDLVPVSYTFLERVNGKKAQLVEDTKLKQLSITDWKSNAKKIGYTGITRAAALALINDYTGEKDAVFELFNTLANDKNLLWEKLTVCEDYPSEVVYDLGIPETKVFALSSGLVIYDTLNFHVPAGEKAKQDVITKMLPSKNVLSIKDFNPIFFPSNEAALGNFHASYENNKNKAIKFKTEEEMTQAFNRGDISVGDQVEIG